MKILGGIIGRRAWVGLLAVGAVASLGLAFALSSTGSVSAQTCNTTLSQGASAGDNVITVGDTTGCDQGDWIVINGGGATEECREISDPTASQLYLVGTLASAHIADETVVEVPVCPTPTPEASPSPSPTPAATASPTPEATASPTPEATASPTPEATASPTPEATASPTPAATPSPTPAATPSPTPAATPSPTPAATAVPATATPAAPPPTGMGQSGAGGSMGISLLLALGGLAALAGAATLTWRFRTRKA